MKYKKWDNFLASASGLQEIMSKPKGCTDLTKSQRANYADLIKRDDLDATERKTLNVLNAKRERFNNPELSASAKKYLTGRYAWDKYGKKHASTGNISSYILKGNELEEEAIKLISKRDKIEYKKGEDFVYNDYIFGRCDIFSPENNKIVDVKTCWSIYSFMPHYNTKLSLSHWLQMQAYLELYGMDNGEVCYVLLNTPTHLVDREIAKSTDRYLFGEIEKERYEEEVEKCQLAYSYDQIPIKRKIITFEVKKDPNIMSKVYERVEKCREWLNEMEKIHMNNKRVICSLEDYAIQAKENYSESDTPDTDSQQPG